jgi:lactobin A/cerein 7B family class IIb bacteriocin
MVASPEKGLTEMEMAMKVEELNMEPHELTLDELDHASGGILPVIVGALAVYTVGFVGGLFFGRWLANR